MESIALRPAGEQDRELLCAIYASTRTEELAQTGWPPEQQAEFLRMQFQAQDAHYRKHYPGAELQVILHGGVPAGRLYVDRWAREIRIMDIALLPEHRGQGIGSTLLRELMREATAAGKALSIHVERFNRALALYERLGFRPVEDKGVYYLLRREPDAE